MKKTPQFYHGYRFAFEIISHAAWLYLRFCLSFRDVWATVGSVSSGPPIWDVVADYLRRSDMARITRLNTPKLKNVAGNPLIYHLVPSFLFTWVPAITAAVNLILPFGRRPYKPDSSRLALSFISTCI